MLDRLTPENLVLGPRPGKKSFDRLSKLNLTHCCSLLGEKETPTVIEKICKRLDCDWVWLPMNGGHLETLQAIDMASYLQTLDAAIADVEAPIIYLHCSAGIHRTGYFAYILLRIMGLGASDALKALEQLREVTAKQVGEERIMLAEVLLNQGAFGVTVPA